MMIILHFHPQPQFTYELFHIRFSSKSCFKVGKHARIELKFFKNTVSASVQFGSLNLFYSALDFNSISKDEYLKGSLDSFSL